MEEFVQYMYEALTSVYSDTFFEMTWAEGIQILPFVFLRFHWKASSSFSF